jgi:hypothetical protein
MAMPHPDHPFRSLKKLHETQLNDFEAMFRAGAAMAIPAAVHYCAEHGLVAPAWLTKASAELFCTILRSDTRKTIARANDVVRQLRGDMRDFARWDAVCAVEDERKHFRREVAKLRALPKTPRELPQKREKLLKEMEERLKSLGATLDCAFECASERLAKTGASGGRDSMEKSYYKVEKIFKDPAQAMRYRQLDQRFLQKVGLKPIMPPPKRKKAVPLFKLTDQRIAVTVSDSRGATIARENIGELKYSRSAQSRRRR